MVVTADCLSDFGLSILRTDRHVKYSGIVHRIKSAGLVSPQAAQAKCVCNWLSKATNRNIISVCMKKKLLELKNGKKTRSYWIQPEKLPYLSFIAPLRYPVGLLPFGLFSLPADCPGLSVLPKMSNGGQIFMKSAFQWGLFSDIWGRFGRDVATSKALAYWRSTDLQDFAWTCHFQWAREGRKFKD